MAKVNPQLKAEIREVKGRKVKHLRKEGLLPATVYGKAIEAVSVQMGQKDFGKVFAEVGEAGLVELVVKDETWPIIFRNPQYHSVGGEVIHIDCYKVNLKEKIRTTVPLVFVGEPQSVRAGNVLVEVSNEVEVEALPADLPERIEVDLTKLETLEAVITVGDLKVDEKISLKTPADQVIAKTEAPRAEEAAPVAEATAAPGEVPATEQKAPEEKAAEAEKSKKE